MTTERQYHLTLNEYQRDNLLWLLGLLGYPFPERPGVEPFNIANTGDWVGEIAVMLDLDAPLRPNLDEDYIRQAVQSWLAGVSGGMGWSRGTEVMQEVINTLKEYVPITSDRKHMYKRLIDAFEDADWDNQDECLGEDDAYDAALKELHPDWGLEEDDVNLGQVAFDAYNAFRGGVNFQGDKTPPWDDLSDGIRQGWEVAAEAVKRCLNDE